MLYFFHAGKLSQYSNKAMKGDRNKMNDHDIIQMIYEDMQGMKADMQGMKADMRDMKADMQDMKADIRGLKVTTADLERKVTDLQLTIENEIRPNIRIIAENHLDLSRKLEKALELESERAMTMIRVTRLESDMKRVKTYIGLDTASAAKN